MRQQTKKIAVYAGTFALGATMLMAGMYAYAQTTGAGFSGKVSSVNAATNIFSAEVRLVYAGSTGAGGIGGVLPPGKVVSITVPAGVSITDARGNAITLANVSTGMLFNAAVFVDPVTKTVTASKIVFGTRLVAPAAQPGASGNPPPPPSAPSSPPSSPSASSSSAPSATPVPSGSVAPQQVTINFAGKINSIDANTRIAGVMVRIVYGSSSAGVRAAVILPGTIYTLTVPQNVSITRLTVPITLADVKVGDLFNARATVNKTAKTGVAGSIQIITPKIEDNVFSGKVTAVATANPKSLSLKNSAGTESTFTITDTTKIYMGNSVPVTLDQVVVGRSAVVAFVPTGGVKQAVKIEVANEQTQAKIDKFKDKYMTVEAIQRRGEHVVNLLDATLARFTAIISKQEAQINDAKAQGKDTADVSAALEKSKTDLAAAQASVADTKVKFDAISSSTDAQAAVTVARTSFKASISAAQKVFADITSTQAKIKLVIQ